MVESSHRLFEVSVVIADSDYQMGQVLAGALREFGIGKIQQVSSGKDALQLVQTNPVDVLITEWQMWPVDGIALVNHLRAINDARSRVLPVIMLTGRSEKIDVEMARDAGITEFVVKPYTTASIFQRIKAIVDTPRGTVVASSYIGPDRRRREQPVTDAEKRHTKPQTLGSASTDGDTATPGIVPPDFALKRRIGITAPLEAIITPEILARAQRSIDNLKDESAHWISADLREAESQNRRLSQQPNVESLGKLRGAVLSVKSRAGTFGYRSLSEAAQITYRFLRMDFQLQNPQHQLVLTKCLEALKILFANGIRGGETHLERPLVQELQLMIAKFPGEKP